ncbi:SDR family oxidoreductase [Sphingomonas colocasiae]|uniref:SDR family oxidoreductase n=1 Tax=Sphingomonas colocasiae TaxID=1848973 RepID=A0ABS7PZ51_9SPHN|nr:SDR family oxidoreductase [Sphingomonas colocasiae]MBY8825617.1 SDR family oxidoreductase [Sphingomonas colocasiae]
MEPAISRRLAVVTGGCGGIGVACAREFGRTHDLVLADISAERVDRLSRRLTEEGHRIVGSVAGDLADGETLASLSALVRDHGMLGVIAHTAGVSSGMADWKTIIRTNVLGTALLLDAMEAFLINGTVAVLVASVAGHLAPADGEVDRLLDAPYAGDLLDQVEHILVDAGGGIGDNSFHYSGLSGPAYGLSKRATIRAAALRSARWAEKGARIVSISPGIINTPMGRYEVEHGEAAAAVLEQTSLRRWGAPMDIAMAAAFLASDQASFITGTDLRVDGGMIPARLGEKCW